MQLLKFWGKSENNWNYKDWKLQNNKTWSQGLTMAISNSEQQRRLFMLYDTERGATPGK